MKVVVLGAALGACLGGCAAAAVLEGLGVPSAPSLGDALLLAGLAATLGGAQGALAPRLLAGRAGRMSVRRIAIGAAFAAFVSLLCASAATGWLDVSVFGAGPAGRLTIVVLPLSQTVAGAVVAAVSAANAAGDHGRR